MPGRVHKAAVAAAIVWSALWASPTLADSLAVPAALQAKLTAKLASFDRAFSARAGAIASVLVVTRSGDAGSTRFAQELMAALKQTDTIGSLPHRETTMTYTNASALAVAVKAQHPAIVYISSGLDSEARAIGDALSAVDVLTISAEPTAVPLGVVVGFDLVSNQPKIVVNLKQAKSQNVQFSGTFLRLASITGS